MKTCKHCGEKRKVGRFYHDSGLPEGEKEICAYCYVDYLIDIGAKKKVIEHTAHCNDIELQKSLFEEANNES